MGRTKRLRTVDVHPQADDDSDTQSDQETSSTSANEEHYSDPQADGVFDDQLDQEISSNSANEEPYSDPQADDIFDTQLDQEITSKSANEDHLSDDIHTDQLEGSERAFKISRGRTTMAHIWTQPKVKRIVKWNKLWQPIGAKASDLANFLGTIARNPELCSLIYTDWRLFPKEEKMGLLQIVKSKFVIPQHPLAEKFVLKSLGKKWSTFKSGLKNEFFDPDCGSINDALKNKPDFVPKDQWNALVTHWISDKCKLRTSKNRESRAEQVLVHNAGSKSFARLMAEKSVNGEEPTRAQLFLETHKGRKTQRTPNVEKSKEVLARIKEKLSQLPNGKEVNNESVAWEGDVYSQVMKEVIGPERYGRVRGLGMVPKALVFNPSKRIRDYLEENHETCNEKIEFLKSHIKKMEEEHARMKEAQAQLQADMAMLKAAVGRRIVDDALPSSSTETRSRNVGNTSSVFPGAGHQHILSSQRAHSA